jgi:CDP-glycerol glycerophosphotransferase
MVSIKSIISKQIFGSSGKLSDKITSKAASAVDTTSAVEVFPVDVSVVMPVYNCEDFIEQAVRSIADHTDCRFEIIAVNDESPDGALDILRRLEAEIPQLKVFDQTNIGGAPTLNRGISYACGKYVAFLDSDDWIPPHALDILFERAEYSQAEVTGGAIERYLEGTYYPVYDTSYIRASQVIDVKDDFNPSLLQDAFYTGKLFLRSHLIKNNIWFPPDLLYADRPFVTKAFLTAKKIALTPNITGYWRKRLDGASITDGSSNPINILDKAIGYTPLLKHKYEHNDARFKEIIFLEGVKRIFWNYPDAFQASYAPVFARAICILLSAYPDYKKASSLSIKQQRILEQAVSYRPEHMHSFLLSLEDVIAQFNGEPVVVLAKALRELPHVGRKLAQPEPVPVLRDFAAQEEDLFVFESFFGKSYGGNPRYVFEELVRSGRKFRAVWVHSPSRKPFKFKQFKNPSVTIIQVARGSAEYKSYLNRAKYWINNIRFSDDIQKPEGTIYLQTWHGTPLKRLGLDIEVEGTEADARESFLNEARNWDYLLAQNTYSSDIFKRSFNISCPVLDEGYPANDFLVDPVRRGKVAAYVRKTYDVPAGKKIITYAPTWRESNRIGLKWSFKNRIQMDFFRLKERFSDEYVVLTRLHHLMANTLQLEGLDGFTRDASKEPDANRLMAATDVLITDFSSIFFDYACSGKPMIFHMYDIENYKNNLRGLYLDPYTDLPGPVTTTENELIAALENIGNWQEEYGARFEKFRERFLSSDDGGAAKRVVDRVFSVEQHKADFAHKMQFQFEKPKARIFDKKPANVSFDKDITLLIPLVADRKDIAKDLGLVLEEIGDLVQILLVKPVSTKLSKKTMDWIETSACDLYCNTNDHADVPLLTEAMSDVRGEYVLVHSLDDEINCSALKLLHERAKVATADVAVSRLLNKDGAPHSATSYITRATTIVTASKHNDSVFRDTSCAGKLFRTEFLTSTNLQPISQEDNNERNFVIKAFAHAKCITVSPTTVVKLVKKDSQPSKIARLNQLRQQTHTVSGILLDNRVASRSVILALASQLAQTLLEEIKLTDKPSDIKRLGTIARVFLFSYPDYETLDGLAAEDVALLNFIRHHRLESLEGFLQYQKDLQNSPVSDNEEEVYPYQIAMGAHNDTSDLQAYRISDNAQNAVVKQIADNHFEHDEALEVIQRFDRHFDTDTFMFMPQSQYIAQSELMATFQGLCDKLAPFTAILVKPENMRDFEPPKHNGSSIVVERGTTAYYFWLSRSKYLFTDMLVADVLKGWDTDADGKSRIVVQTACQAMSKDYVRVGKSALTTEAVKEESTLWTYVIADNEADEKLLKRQLAKSCEVILSRHHLPILLADKIVRRAASTEFMNKARIKSHQRMVGMVLRPQKLQTDIQPPLIDFYYLADKLQYNFVFAVHDQGQNDWAPLLNELRRFLTPDGAHNGLQTLMSGADILVTNVTNLVASFQALGRPVITLTEDFPVVFASSAQKKSYRKAGLVWDEVELAHALRTLDMLPAETSNETGTVAKIEIDKINELLVQALFSDRPRLQNRLQSND